MDDEDRIRECQREIQRLRGVVRELNMDVGRLEKLVQCMGRGMVCEKTDIQKVLVIGGADLELHELLREVLSEERM